MGLILDLSPRVLEKVLYFASYIVLDAGDTDLSFKQILSEQEYAAAYEKWGSAFRVGMGAESIKELLHNIDLDKNDVFGAGTQKAVNNILKNHSYSQNGIAGKKFIDLIGNELLK